MRQIQAAEGTGGISYTNGLVDFRFRFFLNLSDQIEVVWRIVFIFQQMASGLFHIHSCGYVHQNMKP